jgi:hypothetical protein
MKEGGEIGAYNTKDEKYSVSTKSFQGFEKLWRANKLS